MGPPWFAVSRPSYLGAGLWMKGPAGQRPGQGDPRGPSFPIAVLFMMMVSAEPCWALVSHMLLGYTGYKCGGYFWSFLPSCSRNSCWHFFLLGCIGQGWLLIKRDTGPLLINAQNNSNALSRQGFKRQGGRIRNRNIWMHNTLQCRQTFSRVRGCWEGDAKPACPGVTVILLSCFQRWTHTR